MTFDVASISAPQAADPAAAVDSPAANASTSARPDEPVTVDTIPVAPPPEVLDAVRAASQSYDTLAAAGNYVQFASDPLNGRLSALLVDLNGGLREALSPSRVLDLASVCRPAAPMMKGN